MLIRHVPSNPWRGPKFRRWRANRAGTSSHRGAGVVWRDDQWQRETFPGHALRHSVGEVACALTREVGKRETRELWAQPSVHKEPRRLPESDQGGYS
jgi:hypothetical protein